ncbi:hypothetical protein LVB87_11535 [Lysobacter sp. KIS68-7]|uniref:hypothetical protein n=1 Tax=Lysobacter sp. KIS68-7 TaxID=2904252 RepID=UPI001E544A12|nr:hypothetical protein [Lysobacter sp. KIS68-7]UHQ18813.1 hypothetical protein LVB87_11535 [Lysobacter sp. KIS68-7]
MSIDATTALKPDIYRVTTIVLVPGFTAIGPWLAGVFWPSLMNAQTWAGATTVPISVTIFGMVLVAGFVLEDLGSRIEAKILDRWLRDKAPLLFAYWYRYLGLKTDAEVVGQRYLRALLVRFKFELSMVPAAVICGLGFLTAEFLGHGTGSWIKTGVIWLILVELATLMAAEAMAGSVLLARTRRIVVRSCSSR